MSWSELPIDLLDMISKRLATNADYVRFRAVCVPWRSAVGGRPHHFPRQLPWLMQSYEGDSDVRCFYSILEDKVYRLKMPNSREERCCGSSHGWLALVGKSPAIRLLNPLTGDEIQLPPMTTFPGVLEFRPSAVDEEYVLEPTESVLPTGFEDEYPQGFVPTAFEDEYPQGIRPFEDEYVLEKEHASLEYAKHYFIDRIVLSSNPTSNGNCVVLAYLSRFARLAFCRPGDQTWTVIEGSRGHYDDLVCYNGQFVAICEGGKLYLIDVGPSRSMKLVGKLMGIGKRLMKFNLVELAGELLVVLRRITETTDSDGRLCYWTRAFALFKVAFDSEPVKWSRLKSIGNYALFLGATNCSLSYSLDGIPGFNEDSIYFTEDYMLSEEMICKFGSHDVGIYNMENKSIEALPCHRSSSTEALPCHQNIFTTQYIWPPPTWITPSLC